MSYTVWQKTRPLRYLVEIKKKKKKLLKSYLTAESLPYHTWNIPYLEHHCPVKLSEVIEMFYNLGFQKDSRGPCASIKQLKHG